MVTGSAAAQSRAPNDALDERLHNLPTPLSSFVNREDAIAGIMAAMRRNRRLLTLVGVGGVGKTRLALEIARRSLKDFPGGVWFVDLAPISAPDLVLSTVASVLSLETRSEQGVVAAIARRFDGQEALLLLDNCEHLRAACAHFARAALEAVPRLTVLATSREALGVPGEQLWRVAVLELPNRGEVVPLNRMDGFSALRLWRERATEVATDFSYSSTNAKWAIEICQRLDGIPLAIELAASRLSSMSGDDILARLDARFSALGKRDSARAPRQQTLEALIDWSYDLLDDGQRALFRQLSVFAGGWDIEGCVAVCGEPGERADQIVERLSELVDKSLVVFESGDGGGRYRFLNTLWDYARERLDESSEFETVTARHRDWYRSLAAEAERNLRGPEQAKWLRRLETEMPNLRAALGYCLDNDVSDGIELAGTLMRFWVFHAHLTEGRRWLDQLLAAGTESPPEVRALGNYAAGALAYAQADYPTALSRFQEAIREYETLGNLAGRGDALTFMGNVAWRQGDYPRAAELHRRSLAIGRGLGDERRVAAVLNNLGLVLVDQGDYTQARALYEESMGIKQRLGDELGALSSLHNLGIVAAHEGDWERALELQQTALETGRSLGDKRIASAALIEIGNGSLRLGNAGSAGEAFLEALGLLEEIADPLRSVQCLEGLAMVVLELGEQELAGELFGIAGAERARLGTPIAPGEAALMADRLATLESALGTEQTEEARRRGAAGGSRGGQIAQAKEIIARARARETRAAGASDGPASILTAREREILGLVAQGLTNQEMAGRLVVSVRTVETHLGNIYAKIGARGRTEAVAFALRSGLGAPDGEGPGTRSDKSRRR